MYLLGPDPRSTYPFSYRHRVLETLNALRVVSIGLFFEGDGVGGCNPLP